MVPTKTLLKDERERAMTTLTRAIGGADQIPLISEEYGGADMDFADIKPEPTKATDQAALLKRAHAYALFRDAQYGHLNRGQLLALAANNELRIHYEAGRIAILGGVE